MKTLQNFLMKNLESIESRLAEELKQMGSPGRLRDACSYAVLSPGKRFRPILVLLVAEALGRRQEALDAAVAVELFHAASLIADDLPCMDDDSERRNRPSLHVKFDEATAILATYALIAAGYDCLARSGSPERALAAIRNSSLNTGLMGAAGGQYLDLFPTDLSAESQLQVVDLKTVTLFEMSFVLGWLYGAGQLELLPLVKQAARHFGVAFQLVDDLEDAEQDRGRPDAVNLALAIGVEETRARVLKELDSYRDTLRELNIQTEELQEVAETLREKIR